jgi:phosphoenolpyruvate carboxylase
LLLGAWLGAEDALEQAFERGDLDQLKQMYRDWPYFTSVSQLIEMVLAKSDARIAAEYDRQLVPADLQQRRRQPAKIGRTANPPTSTVFTEQ